jgi:EpsI family protein
MIDRNNILIIGLLLLTTFISWKLYFLNYNPDTKSIQNFPTTIGEWTSQELPINKIDQTFLEIDNAFLRRYTNPQGKSVYLYIVYSQSNPKATNPPEIFYSGTNISVLDKGKKMIKIKLFDLEVNWLLLDENRNQQITYYWFKVGKDYTQSYWKQQILIALNNFMNNKKGSALIRVSTDITGRNQEAIDLINEFVGLLIPSLSQDLP